MFKRITCQIIIYRHNAREVISAGANIVVSGSGVFGTSDPVDTMKEFAALT